MISHVSGAAWLNCRKLNGSRLACIAKNLPAALGEEAWLANWVPARFGFNLAAYGKTSGVSPTMLQQKEG
jgi:hypothetical protein